MGSPSRIRSDQASAVIHEKVARPFRCLDPQYRRELVRLSHKRRGASRLRLIDRARIEARQSIIVLMITTSSIFVLSNIF